MSRPREGCSAGPSPAAEGTGAWPRRTFLGGVIGMMMGAASGRREASSWFSGEGEEEEAASASVPASASTGVRRTGLGRGAVTRGGSIGMERGTDVVIDSIAIGPGGTTGWHRHPGPEVVVVTKGTLTFQRSDGVRCFAETVSAGEAFIGAAAGELHAAHNHGPEPVEFVVTFFDVPTGGPARTEADPPATCA